MFYHEDESWQAFFYDMAGLCFFATAAVAAGILIACAAAEHMYWSYMFWPLGSGIIGFLFVLAGMVEEMLSDSY